MKLRAITPLLQYETGNDFLKSHDNVSGERPRGRRGEHRHVSDRRW
jgi:hypothetical protein